MGIVSLRFPAKDCRDVGPKPGRQAERKILHHGRISTLWGANHDIRLIDSGNSLCAKSRVLQIDIMPIHLRGAEFTRLRRVTDLQIVLNAGRNLAKETAEIVGIDLGEAVCHSVNGNGSWRSKHVVPHTKVELAEHAVLVLLELGPSASTLDDWAYLERNLPKRANKTFQRSAVSRSKVSVGENDGRTQSLVLISLR